MSPICTHDSDSGPTVLTSGRLELVIETKNGLNPCCLRDTRTGNVYAYGDYAWPGGMLPKLLRGPDFAQCKDGGRSVTFTAAVGAFRVTQQFTAPGKEPGVIIESLTLTNPEMHAVTTAGFRCGFAKLVRAGDAWLPDATQIRFCPVPYRRETNGQLQEFPLREVAEHGTGFTGWAEPWTPTPAWGAEGWVWSKGTASLLVAKYNAEGMEWSLMDRLDRGKETFVRFGGAGLWKHGHPEGALALRGHQEYRFGETRYQVVEGDWKQGYYAYRGYVESKGCKTPKRYNPPVHWNELYDNEYYFKVCAACGDYINAGHTTIGGDFMEQNRWLLKQYYSLDLMMAEAAKAKEIGCEALYLDPGWDTGPNQQVWDAARLGKMGTFVKALKKEYGLRVSLWNALGCVPPSYGDPETCTPAAKVMDKDGKPTDLVCFASPAYLATKEKRLLELCRNGAAFLMFDSTSFSGPCYDKTHGHHIPSTREDHANALIELAQRVRRKYPKVLIEMHDMVSGPCGIHYTPTYYGYTRPHSFTELWGHEFMWGPMDDLLSQRAVSLYYYNLAYSIPLYLHVNLKQDNENAVVFWWFASTCRHLGIGGKGSPAVWDADKRAMAAYKPLKRFYTQGTFYGIDEMIHAHTLPDLRESVLNVFNLDDKPEQKTIRFRLHDIGLPPGRVDIESPFEQTGDEISLTVSVPARGHQLLRVRVE